MPGTLNPTAAEFVPGTVQAMLDEGSEDGVTENELLELEAAEAWVEAMCDLEEEEKDHLVMLALKYDASSVTAIHHRFAGHKACARARKAQPAAPKREL